MEGKERFLDKDPFEYGQERTTFLKELQNFHLSRRTPIHRYPTIQGQTVDLYLLYSKVLAAGGYYKFTERYGWEDVQHLFHLPPSCANGGQALRQIYHRYLFLYEKVHLHGEDLDGVLMEDDDEAVQSRRRTRQLLQDTHMVYNYKQHNVAVNVREQCGMCTDLVMLNRYERLEKSLLSGLPNETDLAFNVCTLLTAEGSERQRQRPMRLAAHSQLLSLLLAHVELFEPGSGLEAIHEKEWKRYTDRDFMKFWVEVVRKDQIIENLICPTDSAPLPPLSKGTGTPNTPLPVSASNPANSAGSSIVDLTNTDDPSDNVIDLTATGSADKELSALDVAGKQSSVPAASVGVTMPIDQAEVSNSASIAPSHDDPLSSASSVGTGRHSGPITSSQLPPGLSASSAFSACALPPSSASIPSSAESIEHTCTDNSSSANKSAALVPVASEPALASGSKSNGNERSNSNGAGKDDSQSVIEKEVCTVAKGDLPGDAEMRLVRQSRLAKLLKERDSSLGGAQGDSLLNLREASLPRRAEGMRAGQVAVILHNLSFESMNALAISNNEAALRFLFLCAHSDHGSLRQMGLDTLGNVAMKMVLKPVSELYTQLTFRVITACLISNDRFERLRGFEILANLAQVKQNKSILKEHTDPSIYRHVTLALRAVKDIQLIVGALDALYFLSCLGPGPCDQIASERVAVDSLVDMTTVFTLSYGTEGLINMKVIEEFTNPPPPVQSHPLHPVPHHPSQQPLAPPPPHMLRPAPPPSMPAAGMPYQQPVQQFPGMRPPAYPTGSVPMRPPVAPTPPFFSTPSHGVMATPPRGGPTPTSYSQATTPHGPPTPHGNNVTPHGLVPSTPPPVGVGVVGKADAMCRFWVRAYYDGVVHGPESEGRLSPTIRKETLYSEYLTWHQKEGHSGPVPPALNSQQFIQCIRSVYTHSTLVKIPAENGNMDHHITGLRARVNSGGAHSQMQRPGRHQFVSSPPPPSRFGGSPPPRFGAGSPPPGAQPRQPQERVAMNAHPTITQALLEKDSTIPVRRPSASSPSPLPISRHQGIPGFPPRPVTHQRTTRASIRQMSAGVSIQSSGKRPLLSPPPQPPHESSSGGQLLVCGQAELAVMPQDAEAKIERVENVRRIQPAQQAPPGAPQRDATTPHALNSSATELPGSTVTPSTTPAVGGKGKGCTSLVLPAYVASMAAVTNGADLSPDILPLPASSSGILPTVVDSHLHMNGDSGTHSDNGDSGTTTRHEGTKRNHWQSRQNDTGEPSSNGIANDHPMGGDKMIASPRSSAGAEKVAQTETGKLRALVPNGVVPNGNGNTTKESFNMMAKLLEGLGGKPASVTGPLSLSIQGSCGQRPGSDPESHPVNTSGRDQVLGCSPVNRGNNIAAGIVSKPPDATCMNQNERGSLASPVAIRSAVQSPVSKPSGSKALGGGEPMEGVASHTLAQGVQNGVPVDVGLAGAAPQCNGFPFPSSGGGDGASNLLSQRSIGLQSPPSKKRARASSLESNKSTTSTFSSSTSSSNSRAPPSLSSSFNSSTTATGATSTRKRRKGGSRNSKSSVSVAASRGTGPPGSTPLSPAPSLGSPRVLPPPDALLCEWDGCGKLVKGSDSARAHALAAHLPQSVAKGGAAKVSGPCLWEGCDNLVRQKYSLINHVLETHCTSRGLAAARARRIHNHQQARSTAAGDQTQARAPPPVQHAAHPPIYNTGDATVAIMRQAGKGPHEDMQDLREGPVTKHLRYTSALTLRNLSQHSALARSILRRHESRLAVIAFSPVEASGPLCSLLQELQND